MGTSHDFHYLSYQTQGRPVISEKTLYPSPKFRDTLSRHGLCSACSKAGREVVHCMSVTANRTVAKQLWVCRSVPVFLSASWEETQVTQILYLHKGHQHSQPEEQMAGWKGLLLKGTQNPSLFSQTLTSRIQRKKKTELKAIHQTVDMCLISVFSFFQTSCIFHNEHTILLFLEN